MIHDHRHPFDIALLCELLDVSRQGYYGLGQTERHFGLGNRQSVDVSVEFYPSGKKVEQKGVKADSTVVIEEK